MAPKRRSTIRKIRIISPPPKFPMNAKVIGVFVIIVKFYFSDYF